MNRRTSPGRRRLLAALVAIAAPWEAALASSPVGRVVQTVGNARRRATDGVDSAPVTGSPVHVGDRFTTGADARLVLAFEDGTRVFLGPNTAFMVTAYLDLGEEPTFVVTVARGVFRMLTGRIAKARPRAQLLTSPVASVGIRGTHFGGEVTPTSATIVLLEPEEAGLKTAIEVTNDFGAVTIDEPGYGTDVPDERSPPSAPRRMRLRAVENLIRSFSSLQRMR